MVSMDEVRSVKKRYEAELMGKAGVTGCAIGFKYVNGIKTDDPCIVCYVREKKPEKDLKKKDIIPREIEGVPIDVIESGEFRAM